MATQISGIKRLRGFPNFIVDGFNFLQPDVRSYFLTHFHSDHTCGLSSKFDIGTIYCCTTTAALVTQVET
jgi:DNA cross-link repair 1A protein